MPKSLSNSRIAELCSLLTKYRFDLSDEKSLQSEMEDVFIAEDIDHKREYRLSNKDIVDFMLCDSIAVECKLKGHQKKAIYRQLCRYAEHNEVKELVLVSNISMGLPQSINEKPLYYINLTNSWM